MAAKRKAQLFFVLLAILVSSSAFASIERPDTPLQVQEPDRYELLETIETASIDTTPALHRALERALPPVSPAGRAKLFDEKPVAQPQPSIIDRASFEWLDAVSHVSAETPGEIRINDVAPFDAITPRSLFAVKRNLASRLSACTAETNVSCSRELGSKTWWGVGYKAAPFVEPANGMVYLRDRWYDPSTGTWLTPDAYGTHDSSNLYAFAKGDPVNGSDPTGMCEGACIGGIIGGVAGAGYAGYRSVWHGEDFAWRYVGQGALAGAAIGFGIETLGAGSGLSAAVIGGTFSGAGFGGAVGSVTTEGSWSGFAKGGSKGGVLGAIGGATGYGIALRLTGGWAFAGSVAADTWTGAGVDALAGDCNTWSGCVGWNAGFSLGGNALAYGGRALLRTIRPIEFDLSGSSTGEILDDLAPHFEPVVPAHSDLITYQIRPELTPLSGTRRTAINRGWQLERELVDLTGQGTTPWTASQINELLETGRVSGFTGHHINNVATARAWQGDPRNIRFLSTEPFDGHHLRALRGHRGSWRNSTMGRLIDRAAIIRLFRGW